MGARLVGEAIAYAIEMPLHFNEYRLLIGMALTALDSSSDEQRPARRYFDSREAMALTLGRRVPDAHPDSQGCACENCRTRRAAFQAVKVAVAGLDKLGAIERTKRGKAGQRAEFTLRLDTRVTRDTAEYRQRAGYAAPTPAGTAALPHSVGRAYPAGRAGLPPRNNRNHKEQTEELTSPNSTTSLAPVDKSSSNKRMSRTGEAA